MKPPGAPWWVPSWPAILGTGLFGMTWWILYVLSPAKGEEPSELFKLLTQAIVITGFIGGVAGSVYTLTRHGGKKPEGPGEPQSKDVG